MAPRTIFCEDLPSSCHIKSRSLVCGFARPLLSPVYGSAGNGTVGSIIRLDEMIDIAFMGTLADAGNGQVIVHATGGNTHFGSISAGVGLQNQKALELRPAFQWITTQPNLVLEM
jgi:magnesium-transporting ATPase (P-type)